MAANPSLGADPVGNLAIKVYGKETHAGPGVFNAVHKGSYKLSTHQFVTDAGAPTDIGFSNRQCYYFAGVCRSDIREIKEVRDSRNNRAHRTTSVLYGNYRVGTTLATMNKFLEKSFFRVYAPSGPVLDFWVSFLPSGGYKLMHKDHMNAFKPMPDAVADSFKIDTFTVPAFVGEPTVKELLPHINAAWAAGAEARAAEFAARPAPTPGPPKNKSDAAEKRKQLQDALEETLAEQTRLDGEVRAAQDTLQLLHTQREVTTGQISALITELAAL